MKFRILFVSLLLCLAISAGAFAQEQKQMSAEEKAMWDAWMKVATPGEHHKHLAQMLGSYTTASKSWMAPGAPAEESTGTCEFKPLLDGRYVQQNCSGKTMGVTFNGTGITGYNNQKQMYESVWMDSMGTAIYWSTGKCSDNGKTLNLSGKMQDPMTNKPMDIRYVSTITGPDSIHFEMYMPGPDGKEFKGMEIDYTRKK